MGEHKLENKNPTMYDVYEQKITDAIIAHLKEITNGEKKNVEITEGWLVNLVLWGAKMMHEAYTWHAADQGEKILEKIKSIDWDDSTAVMKSFVELEDPLINMIKDNTKERFMEFFEHAKESLNNEQKPKIKDDE